MKQKFDSRQPSLFEDVQPAIVQATVEAVSGAVEVEPGDWRGNPVKGDLVRGGLDVLDRRPFWSTAASSEFHLVPHATFLAWPESVQWRYCAARDRASAVAEPHLQEWYHERARIYEALAE